MLEKLFFISCVLAFWIKATQKDGFLFHYQSIIASMRKLTTTIIIGKTYPCEEPYMIKKFFTCIPCRLFRVSILITFALLYIYGWQGNQMYFYPFVMAGLGTAM